MDKGGSGWADTEGEEEEEEEEEKEEGWRETKAVQLSAGWWQSPQPWNQFSLFTDHFTALYL